MSVEAMSWSFQQEQLPTMARFVLLVLANRADENGYCWPGIADIQKRTGLSERAVQRALKLMKDAGLLEVTAQYRADGGCRSNLYRLLLSTRPMQAPESTVHNGTGRGVSGPRKALPSIQEGGGPRQACSPASKRGDGGPQTPKSSSESSGESSGEQSKDKDPPKSPPSGGTIVAWRGYDAEFLELWEAYPRKIAKQAAYRAWKKARDRPPLDEMLQAIHSAIQSQQWRKGYIPNLATWLNQGRWEDVHRDDPVRPRTVSEWCSLQAGGG